jgi:hypothetical protein
MTYNSLSATPKSLRFGRHIRYMSPISVQNFSSIDDDYKEISPSKETDFKTKAETSDAWISLNTYPNDMKFVSHIYSFLYDL